MSTAVLSDVLSEKFSFRGSDFVTALVCTDERLIGVV